MKGIDKNSFCIDDVFKLIDKKLKKKKDKVKESAVESKSTDEMYVINV